MWIQLTSIASNRLTTGLLKRDEEAAPLTEEDMKEIADFRDQVKGSYGWEVEDEEEAAPSSSQTKAKRTTAPKGAARKSKVVESEEAMRRTRTRRFRLDLRLRGSCTVEGTNWTVFFCIYLALIIRYANK
jgi:hypothetical protein